jgi:hypothetical protein
LKAVLRIATNVKSLLATLLKSVSREEYFEIVSGKWLYGESYVDYIGPDGSLSLDQEKVEILKELQK